MTKNSRLIPILIILLVLTLPISSSLITAQNIYPSKISSKEVDFSQGIIVTKENSNKNYFSKITGDSIKVPKGLTKDKIKNAILKTSLDNKSKQDLLEILNGIDFSNGISKENLQSIKQQLVAKGFTKDDLKKIVGEIKAQGITDVGGRCFGKSKRVSSFVKTMDNGVIKTLESVASVMFVICTTASAIDSVINSVYQALGCCAPVLGVNTVPCAAQEATDKPWGISFTTFVNPVCCFVNCQWCTKGGGSCMGIFGDVLGKLSILDKTPALVDNPNGKTGGIGQFHLSPYENIYTAIGCMCPVAILFNLRKLKTIYQVYDCCLQESCKNALSTEGCEKQLSEATCMYWEGSLYKMLLKAVLSLVTNFISKLLTQIIAKLSLQSVLYCGLAVWDLANVPGTIKGVKSSWKWTKETFDEPDCKDLGFDKVKDQMESGPWSESAGISKLTLNDKDGDGRYDSVVKNYQKEKIKFDDLPDKLKGDSYFKKVKDYRSLHLYKYNVNGKDYYEIDISRLKDWGNIYTIEKNKVKKPFDLNKKDERKKWNELLKTAKPPITNVKQIKKDIYKIDGKWYSIQNIDNKNHKLLLINEKGDKKQISFKDLAGKNFKLGDINLKDYKWDDKDKLFIKGKGETQEILKPEFDNKISKKFQEFTYSKGTGKSQKTKVIYQFNDGITLTNDGNNLYYHNLDISKYDPNGDIKTVLSAKTLASKIKELQDNGVRNLEVNDKKIVWTDKQNHKITEDPINDKKTIKFDNDKKVIYKYEDNKLISIKSDGQILPTEVFKEISMSDDFEITGVENDGTIIWEDNSGTQYWLKKDSNHNNIWKSGFVYNNDKNPNIDHNIQINSNGGITTIKDFGSGEVNKAKTPETEITIDPVNKITIEKAVADKDFLKITRNGELIYETRDSEEYSHVNELLKTDKKDTIDAIQVFQEQGYGNEIKKLNYDSENYQFIVNDKTKKITFSKDNKGIKTLSITPKDSKDSNKKITTYTYSKDGKLKKIEFRYNEASQNYKISIEDNKINQIKYGGTTLTYQKTINEDGKKINIYHSGDTDYKIKDNKLMKWDDKNKKWEEDDKDNNIKTTIKEVDSEVTKTKKILTSKTKKSIQTKKSKSVEINEAKNLEHLNRATYDLSWRLLNDVLGKYAYKAIDDMCKED